MIAIAYPAQRGLAAAVIAFALARAALADPYLAPSPNPPGSLAPANTPQLMLLTVDDLIDSNRAAWVDLILTNHWNPNGSPIQATFFLNTDWTDFRAVRSLYARGHEIAVHTMTHTTGTNTALAAWRAEIVGCRKVLSEQAGVPLSEIRGFRAPYMMYNDPMFRILQEQGFVYDASVIETPGFLSANGATYIWPYTLDQGVQQTPWTGILPTNTFPGMYEVPMWDLLDGTGQSVTVMDPGGNFAQLTALLQTNFTTRYTGNRAPMGVFIHADWLSTPPNRNALNAFIDWTMAGRSNVWWISTHDLVAYMRTPQSSANALAFAPFVTVTNAMPPTNQFHRCVYDIGVITTCTNCPLVYPRPDTVYVEPTPYPGGTLRMEVLQLYSTSYWARMTVSNTTGRDILEWGVSFQVPGGGISAIADGLYSTQGSTITIQPDYWMRPLQTNEQEIVEFGGPRSGPVTFTNQVLQLYTLGPQRPEITSVRPGTNGTISLEWDESAYGYRLERASQLQPSNWTTVADIHAGRAWTNTPPGRTGYYRVIPIP
ncbi:MAG: polysaccharide deacetylase family protein [Lentisphaerae bacterium]|nr:polysaccharide deacetylase family protein [Lentisphaerota bacterium]